MQFVDAETQRRIELFRQHGGIPLGELEPEALVHAQTGILEVKRAVYIYVCPMCGRQDRTAQAMEPMCTGPSWTDDHPPEIMTYQDRATL